jgi:hypothetical protein
LGRVRRWRPQRLVAGAGAARHAGFDVVTGVSTGALIAPFAFLGDAQSIDTIVDLYRNPR